MTNTNNRLGYEVGDDVYIFSSHYGAVELEGPHKVTKVTPTGRITLSNGSQWLNHGKEVGSGTWSRTFIERKAEQPARAEAFRALIRTQSLKRRLRSFRDDFPLDVSGPQERIEIAILLESMAQELREFDA